MKKETDDFKKGYQDFLNANIVIPDDIRSQYEICDCISETKNQAVYLVCDLPGDNFFVLKTADTSVGGDLKAEFDLLSSLSHPTIPKAIAFYEQKNIQYLIREYIPGQTLTDYVAKSGKQNSQSVCNITLQICDVLNYLHAQKPPIIHRDIKSQNIIISEDGSCRLIDFGISRRYNANARQDTTVLGTESTAAPEQFGYQQTDAKSDIYSLGILMLFLATESLDSKNTDQISNRRLRTIIEKCLRFDPKDRYPTIKRVQAKLKQVIWESRFSVCQAFSGGLLLGFAACAVLGLAIFQLRSLAFSSEKDGIKAPTVTVSADESVVFTSPLIEKAVRQELDLGENDIITEEDLLNVTRILICGTDIYDSWDSLSISAFRASLNNDQTKHSGSITSLEDIAMLKNLRQLALYNQQISDLSPLEGLNLSQVALGGNYIVDISALCDSPNIYELNLINNPIEDITAVSSMENLQSLDIGNTKVSDISPLKDSSLLYLWCNDAFVTDYSPLIDTELYELYTSNVKYESAYSIGSISSLTSVTFIGCQLDDLVPLFGLVNLEQLNFWNCSLSTLLGVDHFQELQFIGLGFTSVTDISPLTPLKKLQYLTVYQSPITDFSALEDIPSLQQVNCDTSQASILNGVAETAGFAVNVESW